MRTIVHHPNYLLRYALCFLSAAAFIFISPAWLPWPLRTSLLFSVLMIYLFIRMKGRLIAPVPNKPPPAWRQTISLWGWQSGAILYWLGLLSVSHSTLHYPNLSAQPTWFMLDAISKIPLLAIATSMLAYVTYRYHRPLTLVAFFPRGSHSLTRLVIFGNAWLRDATTILCLFGVSASVACLLAKTPLFGTRQAAIASISFLLTAAMLKARPIQRQIRSLATQYGFASTMAIILLVFIGLLAMLYTLFTHWQVSDFKLPIFLCQLDAYTLSQCLSLMIIAPLAFKSATFCRGLSIRQAILIQCLNPILFIGLGLYYGAPTVHYGFMTEQASCLIAVATLAASLYYGNSTWFASMTERCFTDTGHQNQGPLHWFFNQRLQYALLVWLLILQLGAGRIAMIFLGGIAVGLMIVYSYFYCLFWERLRDEP